ADAHRIDEVLDELGNTAGTAQARRPNGALPPARHRGTGVTLHHVEHGRALIPDIAILEHPFGGGFAHLARLAAMLGHPTQLPRHVLHRGNPAQTAAAERAAVILF